MHTRLLFASFSIPKFIAYIIAATTFLFFASFIYAADTAYTYDSLHRLTKFSHDGTVIDYEYDANGNRLVKSVCAPCRGDLNEDGRVDVTDLRIITKSFGRHRCQAKSICPADFDADGDVDARDLKVFRTDFGRRDCLICQ